VLLKIPPFFTRGVDRGPPTSIPYNQIRVQRLVPSERCSTTWLKPVRRMATNTLRMAAKLEAPTLSTLTEDIQLLSCTVRPEKIVDRSFVGLSRARRQVPATKER
jgi:hypothetical protein